MASNGRTNSTEISKRRTDDFFFTSEIFIECFWWCCVLFIYIFTEFLLVDSPSFCFASPLQLLKLLFFFVFVILLQFWIVADWKWLKIARYHKETIFFLLFRELIHSLLVGSVQTFQFLSKTNLMKIHHDIVAAVVMGLFAFIHSLPLLSICQIFFSFLLII